MTGTVNDRREPMIRLRLIGPRGKRTVPVLVDTGYTGTLVIPVSLAAELGLRLVLRDRLTLADGTMIRVERYFVTLRWFGESVDTEAVVNPTLHEPIVGMAMLDDCRLTVEAWDGGGVRLVRRRETAA